MADGGAAARPAGEAAALATVWAVAAAALREPEEETLASLADPAVAGEVEAALDRIAGPGSGGPREAFRALRDAAARAGVAGLGEERARVFGHAVRGPCPPYEIEYGRDHFLGQSRRLGDLRAFYAAFGVDVDPAARERADHAAVEAEFLSLLALKRARAESGGEDGRASVCRDAERSFLEAHLGRFLPSLARRVGAREPRGFLAAGTALAADLARIHARAVGARAGTPELELREVGSVEEETVVSCARPGAPGAGTPPACGDGGD
jgi:TorA maturation chaperone TorD